MNDVFFIIFHFKGYHMGLSHCATRVVTVDDMSCEHEEVLRTARAAVASQGSSPPAETPTSFPYRRSLPWQHSQSYSVAAQYTLPLRQLPEQTGQLLRDDRCRDMGICIGGINDNRATVI